jgi:superfamily II DNA or RNA helicase
MKLNRIILKITYNDYSRAPQSFRDKLVKLARYNKESRCWFTKITNETIEFIDSNKELISNYKSLKEDINKLLNIESLVKYQSNTIYQFQKEAVKKAVQLHNFGESGINIFFDVGLGKTLTSLEIMYNINKKEQTIILCPKSLRDQWKDEILKFNFGSKDDIQIINGSAVTRKLLWYNDKKYKIASYETFRIDNKENDLKFNYIILDESTKIKNPMSKISSFLYQKLTDATFTINLTGTPIENSLIDLFVINRMHDRFTYNANSWKFKNNHCLYESVYNRSLDKEINVIAGYKKIPEFLNMISNHTIFIKKDDININLPDVVEVNRFIKASSQQKKAQREVMSQLSDEEDSIFTIFTLLNMLDDSVTTLSKSKSDKANFLKGKEIKEDSLKIEQLLLDMEEIGYKNQVIIFSHFIESSQLILKKLLKAGYEAKYYNGDANLITQFKNNEFQVLIAGDNLSYGVSFSDVDYLINFSLHPNNAVMIQRTGRIHRIDSTNKKFVFNYIGGVIGYRIYNIIKDKSNLFSEMNIMRKVVKE